VEGKDAMAKTSLLVALTALFVGVLLSFSTGEVWHHFLHEIDC